MDYNVSLNNTRTHAGEKSNDFDQILDICNIAGNILGSVNQTGSYSKGEDDFSLISFLGLSSHWLCQSLTDSLPFHSELCYLSKNPYYDRNTASCSRAADHHI